MDKSIKDKIFLVSYLSIIWILIAPLIFEVIASYFGLTEQFIPFFIAAAIGIVFIVWVVFNPGSFFFLFFKSMLYAIIIIALLFGWFSIRDAVFFTPFLQ